MPPKPTPALTRPLLARAWPSLRCSLRRPRMVRHRATQSHLQQSPGARPELQAGLGAWTQPAHYRAPAISIVLFMAVACQAPSHLFFSSSSSPFFFSSLLGGRNMHTYIHTYIHSPLSTRPASSALSTTYLGAPAAAADGAARYAPLPRPLAESRRCAAAAAAAAAAASGC